jgi:hypothetical protein
MRLLAAILALLLPAPALAEDLHTPWDGLLSRYLSDHPDGVSRFDYDALRASEADSAALNAYIQALEAAQPSTMGEDEAFAYWANLYNAVTVRLIVEEAPERSIREIRPRPWSIGPWGVDRVTVEGEALSLDNIEHDIMRPRYQAALVHYAVNCASIGCPNLKSTAWRGENLKAELDIMARAYVNHPRGVTATERGVTVSRIYRWFREDFGGTEAGVIAHLLEYAEPELAAAIEADPNIAGHAYDWALNQP